MSRKLILKNLLSPGDIVTLTAAVRTPCPHLWENNPHITSLDEKASDVETIDCHYTLIHQSNQAPYHFIHGFIHFLNERLNLAIRPTEFKGDIRGKTDLRQLVRLVYHAQGVLCPVTSLMHLAAAVEVKGGMPKNRPCVVVGGGREPSHWEAYPHHQYIHTNGALRCCDNGGCWKSRVVPLGDGDEKDRPENLCVDVVGNLPRCLDMITAATVIKRIEMYFDGGVIQYLLPEQYQAARCVFTDESRVTLGKPARMELANA